jgi:hypothetical protein
VPVDCQLETAQQRGQLELPPDKLAQPTPGRALEAGAQRSQPRHLVNPDRFAYPLELCLAQRAKLEVAFAQSLHRLAHQHRTGLRQRL